MTYPRLKTWHLVIPALMLATAGSAHGALLSTLMTPGETIQVGDLLFSNFSYSPTGDMPDPSAINVNPYTSISGDAGLNFQGSFVDFLGASGSDGVIGYTVATLTPGDLITSAALSGVPTVLGGSGVVSVTESFQPTNFSDTLSIFSISPGSTQNTANVTFASGYSSLDVQDAVLAYSVSGTAGLSFFTPTFHTSATPIPEPASATLLGLGAVALVWRRWRKKS